MKCCFCEFLFPYFHKDYVYLLAELSSFVNDKGRLRARMKLNFGFFFAIFH